MNVFSFPLTNEIQLSFCRTSVKGLNLDVPVCDSMQPQTRVWPLHLHIYELHALHLFFQLFAHFLINCQVSGKKPSRFLENTVFWIKEIESCMEMKKKIFLTLQEEIDI